MQTIPVYTCRTPQAGLGTDRDGKSFRLLCLVNHCAIAPLAVACVHAALCGVASGQNMTLQRAVVLLESEDGIAAAQAALWLGSQETLPEQAIAALAENLADEREAIRFPDFIGVPQGPPTVGEYCASALTRLGSPKVASIVSRFVANTNDRSGRLRGLEILRTMGMRARDSIPTLRHLFTDDDEWIRAGSLRAAVTVMNQAELLPVLRVALGDEDPNVKAIAVDAIGQFGAVPKSLLPELINLLDSPQFHGVGFAADAGGSMPLRIGVAVALGRFGSVASDAIPKLERMLEDDDQYVQIAAAFAHASISGQRSPAFETLYAELKKHPGGAYTAVQYLAELSQNGEFAEASFKGIRTALSHPSPDVRRTAARAMSEFVCLDAVMSLIPVLDDEDSWVRRNAAESLGDLRAKSAPAIPHLIAILNNKERFHVIEAAVVALGKIGPSAKSAIPHLKRLVESSSNAKLQELVAEALNQIDCGE